MSRFAAVWAVTGLVLSFLELAEAAETTSVLRGGLLVNEALISPDGGANGYDTDHNETVSPLDQFVEIANFTNAPIDLSGLQLWDAENGNWFTFPSGVVLTQGYLAFVVAAVQPGGHVSDLCTAPWAYDAGLGAAALASGSGNLILLDPAAAAGLGEFVQLRYGGAPADDPTNPIPGQYVGFPATASRVGSVEDWGNETPGTSLVRSPAGDTNVAPHATVFPRLASPGASGLLVRFEGRKFQDLDLDTLPGAGEPFLNGWTIELRTGQGTVLDTQATEDRDLDGNGSIDPASERGWYSFDRWPPGQYRVQEVQQPGWKITRPFSGRYIVSVQCERTVDDLNFGNIQGVTLEGRTFEDGNANGQRDTGEPYLNGWFIDLDGLPSSGRGAATTADWDRDQNSSIDPETETGWYRFVDLLPGTHSVHEIVPAGWVQTSPASGFYTVELAPGESASGLDFGNVVPSPTATSTVTATATATPTATSTASATATPTQTPTPISVALRPEQGAAGPLVFAGVLLLAWRFLRRRSPAGLRTPERLAGSIRRRTEG